MKLAELVETTGDQLLQRHVLPAGTASFLRLAPFRLFAHENADERSYSPEVIAAASWSTEAFNGPGSSTMRG